MRSLAAAVLGLALISAGAGCRQLFGIDDTEVASDHDASTGDARSDARGADAAPVSCAEDHMLCMDFDSASTGFGQLFPFETGSGSIGEADAMDAPSPPRVLRATAASGSSDTAYGGAVFPAETFNGSVRIQFMLRVPGAGTTCSPTVVAIVWDPLMTASEYAVEVTVGTTIAATISTPTLVYQVAVPVQPLTWTAVQLDLAVSTGTVRISAGMATDAMIVDPLMGASLEDAGLGFGMVLDSMHGACTVELDNVVVDDLLAMM